MYEAFEGRVMEFQEGMTFARCCYGNVASLLKVVERNLEVEEVIPPEIKVVLAIAALRAKLPVFRYRHLIKRWKSMLSFFGDLGRLEEVLSMLGEDSGFKGLTDFSSSRRTLRYWENFSQTLVEVSLTCLETPTYTSELQDQIQAMLDVAENLSGEQQKQNG